MFYGVFPLLLGLWTERPPIISVSMSPIVLSSIDASPFNPAVTVKEKECNRQENARFQASLACVNDYLDHLLHSRGCRSLPGFFLDCMYTLPDLLLQLSVESLEFPRSDMPDHIKFVGPVLPRPDFEFQPPGWWKELDGSRPVVLVTQGTVANLDLNELIGPTLAGLADEDVTVIAATGKPADALASAIPSNAKVTSFIPFRRILPKVDVFVTNGGFGGVNQALSMGVPMVVAGDSEDKALVAPRVAWTGAGISLGTSRPRREEIRYAVREILRDQSYHAKARLLYKDFAQYDALESITSCVESFLGCPSSIELAYELS
jgi:UDP:flavonoid glycosyltransferase YjiC (YdhE family)